MKNRNSKFTLVVAAWLAVISVGSSLDAAVVIVDDPMPEAIAFGNGSALSITFSALGGISVPQIRIENVRNELSWSVRVSGGTQVFESLVTAFSVRKYEPDQTIRFTDPAIDPLFVRPLWDDRPEIITEWTDSNPTGIVGLILSGESGEHAAFIEVTVDPSQNGLPSIERYGYETLPNTDLVIPEASTSLMLVCGVVCLFARRRRQNKTALSDRSPARSFQRWL